jgi:hypothetical protein
MTANILVATSAAIVGLLGVSHVALTLWGPQLLPRDRSLKAAMERDSPVITRQTTIWRAWIGFNISHGMGAILFGLVYGTLAIAHGELLFDSILLQAAGFAMLVSYVALAKLYWFVTPLVGTSVSLACYSVGIVLAWAGW